MEFSMPTFVSTMRTGGLPPRGSGVTVFVTKASRERAVAGAVSASRQPEALSSTEHRPLDAEALPLAADLDGAAVAGAVAARHRRLPGELRARGEGPNGSEHRLRAAGEDVEARPEALRHVLGLQHDLGVRHERRGFRVMGAAEAEQRVRPAERGGQERERRDADPAPDEQRALDVEAEAVAERPEHREAVPAAEAAEGERAGADRIDQERELTLRGEAEAHRTRQQPSRRLEHEELTRHALVDAAARDAQRRVRPDGLRRDDAQPLSTH